MRPRHTRAATAFPGAALLLAAAACGTSFSGGDTGYACDAAGRCRDGYVCDKAANVCIPRAQCTIVGGDGYCQRCGDGAATGSEACDDRGDSARCDADCTLPECGDARVNTRAGEQCDDGAANSATRRDACRPVTCARAACGDRVVDSGESCDDGNSVSGDGCAASTCAVEGEWVCRGDPSRCWRPFVRRVVVADGLRGELAVDFREPLDDRLADGLTELTAIALELFAVDTTDRQGNRIPSGLADVVFARADGARCVLGGLGDEGCDRAVLRLAPTSWTCEDAPQRLHYAATYHVRVSSTLRAADGEPSANAPGDFEWEATTAAPPRVTAVVSGNGTTDCDLLSETCNRAHAEGPRVPVNSVFALRFSEPVHPASLVASSVPNVERDTILLRDPALGCYIPVVISSSAPTLFRVHVGDPQRGSCPEGREGVGLLAFAVTYELVVRGRSSNVLATHDCGPNLDGYAEVCAADGRPLERELVIRFTTSAANRLTELRAWGACNAAIQMQLARPVALATLNAATLRVTQDGMDALDSVARDPDDPRWLIATPRSRFCDTASNLVVAPQGGLEDELGNPFPALTSHVVTRRPAIAGGPRVDVVSPAQQPSDPDGSCTAQGEFVLPATPVPVPAAQVSGDASIEVRMQLGDAGQPRLSTARAGGIVVLDVTDATPAPVPGEVFLGGMGNPDADQERLVFRPRRYFKAGRLYRFHLTEGLENVAGVAVECSSFASKLPVYFRGGGCPPGSVCGPSLNDATPAPEAAGLPSSTVVTLTFNEAVDPASLRDAAGGGPADRLQLLAADGSSVPGSIAVSGELVELAPLAPLAPGRYTVRLGDAADAAAAGAPCKDPTLTPLAADERPRAVTDTAGNCLRATPDWSFTVAPSRPTVLPLSSVSQPPGAVLIRFSDPLDASTLGPTTYRASSGLSCVEEQLRGCVTLRGPSHPTKSCEERNACNEALYVPPRPHGFFERRTDAGNVPWTLTLEVPPVADAAGNPIDLRPGTAEAMDFDGAENTLVAPASTPRLLCTVPAHDPLAERPIPPAQQLVLTFNEPMELQSMSAVRVENVCTGEVLAVTMGVVSGGSEYTLLPVSGTWPDGAVIDVSVGTSVRDSTGARLEGPAHVRFKTGAPGPCP